MENRWINLNGCHLLIIQYDFNLRSILNINNLTVLDLERLYDIHLLILVSRSQKSKHSEKNKNCFFTILDF